MMTWFHVNQLNFEVMDIVYLVVKRNSTAFQDVAGSELAPTRYPATLILRSASDRDLDRIPQLA
jgi:hypothetical protein